MDIFEKIRELNTDSDAYLYTVIDGEAAGFKAIVEGGLVTAYGDQADRWFKDHDGILQTIKKSGIHDTKDGRVYVEALGKEKTMVICGAGHVSMAIIDLARMIGFRIVVIDDRLQFAENAIARGADEVICKPFAEALSGMEGSQDHYFVVVTRGHRYDKDCLIAISDKAYAYVGMMGSKRRTILVKKDLTESGISQDFIDDLHTPIGLGIGAETPEEIAVSIMAEIIEVKNRKKNYGFPSDIIDALRDKNRDKVALATIISRRGSAPRGIGTKMIMMRDGTTLGTIGGGCIEGSVIQKGRRMLINEKNKPAIVTVDLSNETAEDEGMVCGGTVDVLIEVV